MGIDPLAPRSTTSVPGPLPSATGTGTAVAEPVVAPVEVAAPVIDGSAAARSLADTEASHGTDVVRSAISGPRREFAEGLDTLQELIRWVGAHPDAPEAPRARTRIAELTRDLRRQATELREHLRTAPRELTEDHRLLRSFYRSASGYLEGHRAAEGSRAYRSEETHLTAFREGAAASEASLRALRDQLRTTTREGTAATSDTLGRARLSAELSRELGDAPGVLSDLRDWNRILRALPESERSGNAGNERLEELLEFAAGCETAGLNESALIALNAANRFSTQLRGSARTLAQYQILMYGGAIAGPVAERIVRSTETALAGSLSDSRYSEDFREARAVDQARAILWLRAHGHTIPAPEALVTALQTGGGLLRDLAAAISGPPADAEAALRRLSGRVARGPAERMVLALAADPSAAGLDSYDSSVHLELAQLDNYSAELGNYTAIAGLTGTDLAEGRRVFTALRNSRDRVMSHLSEDPAIRAAQLREVIETDRALLAFANHTHDADSVTSITTHATARSSELRTLRDQSIIIARDESRPRSERLAHIRIAHGADVALEAHHRREIDLVLWQTLITGADDTVLSAADRLNDMAEIFAGFHELRQRHYDERSADLRDDRSSWTAILTFGLAGESTGTTIAGRVEMSEADLTRHMGEMRDGMVALLPGISPEDPALYTSRLTALVDASPGSAAGTAAGEILPYLGTDGLRSFMELPATREAALQNLVNQANSLADAGNLSDVYEGPRITERPLSRTVTLGTAEHPSTHPLSDYLSVSGGAVAFTEAYNALSVQDRTRVMREAVRAGHVREYQRLYETALGAGSPLQHWHHGRMMLEEGNLTGARADLSRFLHDTRGSTDPEIVAARRSALEMNRVFLNQALDRMSTLATELYNQRMSNIELNEYDEAQYHYDTSLIDQLRRAINDPDREISSIDEAIDSLRAESDARIRAFGENPEIRTGFTVDVRMADLGDSHGVPRDQAGLVAARYAADPDGDIAGLHTVTLRGGALYFDATAEGNRGRDERGMRGRAMLRVRVGAEGGDVVLRIGAEQRIFHFEPGASDRYVLINEGEVFEGRREILTWDDSRPGLSTAPNESNPDHPHYLRGIVGGIRYLTGRDREFNALLNHERYEAVLRRGESPEAERTMDLALARELRARNGSYTAASEILERLMGPELARIRADIPASEIARVRREVEANRGEMATRVRHRVFDEYDRRGLARPTQTQIDQMIEDAVLLETTTRLRNLEYTRLSARVASGAVTDPTVRDAWTMYNDMNDPTGEWLNFSDTTVDAIVTEVAINAPLMAISGGAANLAAGGARMLLTRAAARYLAEAGTEYIVSSGGRLALGAASRRLLVRGGIYAAGTVVEGATFEVTNRALRASLLGEAGLFDHPGELGRAMGASILMMGAIHGGNALWGTAARRVGLAGETAVVDAARSSTSRALRGAVNWTGQLATEGLVLTGVGYANPILFGGPAEHGDFAERLGHSLGTILELRLGGRLFNALTGNALPTLQANLENRILQTRLRGVVEHGLGVDPTSADGRVLIEALNLRMASGTSIDAVEGMASRERLESLRSAVRDRLGVDPASERGQMLTALLLNDVMGRARRPEGMAAALEALPERLRSLDASIGGAVEGAGLRGERATELRRRLLEQALARGLSGEDVTSLSTGLSQMLERGGFSDAAEAGSLRLSLLQFAIETGRSAADIQALVEHAPGLAERVHDLTNALYGEGASGTPFGRNVGAELLTWALSRATRPEDLPRVMEHLTDAGPRIRESLEGARRGLGFSGDSAEGLMLSHHLLGWALSGAGNPAEIARRLDTAARESAGLRETVDGFVRELGYRPDSAEGARVAFALLLQVRGEAGATSAFNATRLAAYANSARELGRQVDLMLATEGRADLRPHRSRILAWALGNAATPEALHNLGLEIQSGRRELRVAPDGTISVVEHPEIPAAAEAPAVVADAGAPVIPLEGRSGRASVEGGEPDLLAAFRHADPREPPSRELLRRSFALADRLARQLGLSDPHDASVSRPFREAIARRAAEGPITETMLREIRTSFGTLDGSLHGVDPMMRTEVRRRIFSRMLNGEITPARARELAREIREGAVRIETTRDGGLGIAAVPAEGRAEARATAEGRIFEHLAATHLPETTAALLRDRFNNGSLTLERMESLVESLPALRRWIADGGVEPSSRAGVNILNRTILGLAEGRLTLREGRVVEVRTERPREAAPVLGDAEIPAVSSVARDLTTADSLGESYLFLSETFLNNLGAEIRQGRLTITPNALERVRAVMGSATLRRAMESVPHGERIGIQQAMIYAILEGRAANIERLVAREAEIADMAEGDARTQARSELMRDLRGWVDGTLNNLDNLAGYRLAPPTGTTIRAPESPRVESGGSGFFILSRFNFTRGPDAGVPAWSEARHTLESFADTGMPPGPLANLARRTRGALGTIYDRSLEISRLESEAPNSPRLAEARTELAAAEAIVREWDGAAAQRTLAHTEGTRLAGADSGPHGPARNAFHDLRLALEPETAPEGSELHNLRDRVLEVDSNSPDAAEIGDAWLDPARGDQGRNPIEAGRVTMVVRETGDIDAVARAAEARFRDSALARGDSPRFETVVTRSTAADGSVTLEFSVAGEPHARLVLRVVDQATARSEFAARRAAADRAPEARPIPAIRGLGGSGDISATAVGGDRETLPPGGRRRGASVVAAAGGGDGEGTRPGTPRAMGVGTEVGSGGNAEGTRPATPRRMPTPVVEPAVAAVVAEPVPLAFTAGPGGIRHAELSGADLTIEANGSISVGHPEREVRVEYHGETHTVPADEAFVLANFREGDLVGVNGRYFVRAHHGFREVAHPPSVADMVERFNRGERIRTETGGRFSSVFDLGDGRMVKVAGTGERRALLDNEQSILSTVHYNIAEHPETYGTLADFVPSLVGRPDPAMLLLGRVPGRTLESAVSENPNAIREIPTEAWDRFRQNLELLNRMGISHGDINLSNIMWDGHTLRLIDFGHSRFVEAVPGARESLDMNRLYRELGHRDPRFAREADRSPIPDASGFERTVDAPELGFHPAEAPEAAATGTVVAEGPAEAPPSSVPVAEVPASAVAEPPSAPVIPLRPSMPPIAEAPRSAALATDVVVMGDTVLIGEEVFNLRTETADAVMGEVPPVARTVFRFGNTTIGGGADVALALPSNYTAEDAARMVSRLSPSVRRSLSRLNPADAGRIVELSGRMRTSPATTTVEAYPLPAAAGGGSVGSGAGASVTCTGEIVGVGSGRTTFRGYVTEADGTRRPVAIVMLTHSMGGDFDSEALNLSRLMEAGVGEVRFDGRIRLDGRQALVVNLAEGTPHVGLGDLSPRDRADFNPLMARDLARMAVAGYTSGAGTDFQYVWGRDARGRPHLRWIDTESSVLPIDAARTAALRTRLGRETLTAQDWYLENLRGFGLYDPATGRFAEGIPHTFQDALNGAPGGRSERSSTIPPPA